MFRRGEIGRRQPAKYRQPVGGFHVSQWTPPWGVECGYYLYLFYAVFGSVWGLSLPPLLAGGSIAALAGLCILRLKSHLKELLAPMALLLGCLVSFLLIQIVIHGEPLIGSMSRPFIVCILGLILIRCLCLRPGLGHRLTTVLFLVGLTALPYIGFKAGVDRAYIEEAVSGNLSNANGLAEWFGFCAVYFGTLGLETKRGVVRTVSWSAAILALFVVGLTVSRGTLLACGIALVLALRRIFKRGVVPLVFFIMLVWAITESGLFRDIFGLYLERGTEETGRFLIWPEVIKELLRSPVVGWGAANSVVILPGEWHPRTTHNTFLFFAMSSGIIPALFFVSFWIVALRRSFANIEQQEYGPFRAPLLMYVLVISFTGDLGFTFPTALLGLVLGVGAGASYPLPGFLVVPKKQQRHTYQVPRRLRPGVPAFVARRRFRG